MENRTVATKGPTAAQVDDFWKRMDSLPKTWFYRIESEPRQAFYGPFADEETAREYADNSDCACEVLSMVHPDAVIAAIAENDKAFAR